MRVNKSVKATPYGAFHFDDGKKMKYRTRKATWDDFDYLDELVTDNMKGYVEKVSTWNPVLFRKHFDPDAIEVIEINGKVIGFTKLVHRDNEFYLGEIQIEREYQNQGIGTEIIKSAITKAEQIGKCISLNVIKGNPVENLYKRLGFEVLNETETHRRLQRMPSKPLPRTPTSDAAEL